MSKERHRDGGSEGHMMLIVATAGPLRVAYSTKGEEAFASYYHSGAHPFQCGPVQRQSKKKDGRKDQ